MEGHVPLDREFSPVYKSEKEAESEEFLLAWGHAKPITWDVMAEKYRCVILAEAGAGKTEELRHRASSLAGEGKAAFFLRIEDIETDFYTAFEIGAEAQFHAWLQSTDEAWFFLDSVDEARLEHPRAFEKALRRFARGVANGAHRAHIYISSRPYAWRPKEDQRLVDELLYLPAAQTVEVGEGDRRSTPQSALTVFTLRPLDEGQIRRFCVARAAENVDGLIREIDRADLWSLAERPFDLEGILAKWAVDNALGGRLDLLRHNIDKRLRDTHSTDRAQRQPLNLEQAREGARCLAAAVVLSGQAGLNVPDATPLKPGIDAEAVLAAWNPEDVRALLERGIFNDIIYGAVRFRHREVRELLAAEWFSGLLMAGNSRHLVEALFFREQYGQEIVTPRLRAILPWLILFDDEIRRKALQIHPEIAVEGGDPSHLPLAERQGILAEIVQRITSDQDDRSARDNSAIARIANLDLSDNAQQLITAYADNDDAIFFLGRLVWQGEMASCVASLLPIAADGSRGIYARIASARAVMTCGAAEQKQSLWQQLIDGVDPIPRELLAELVVEASPDSEVVGMLVVALGKLSPDERYKTSGLAGALHGFVERLSIAEEHQAIARLISGLHAYLEQSPYVERRECHVSKECAWLLGPASHAVEKLVAARSDAALSETSLSIMLMVTTLRHWQDEDLREYKTRLHALVPAWPELNDSLYWFSIEQARLAQAERTGDSLTDDWPASWLGPFWKFDSDSFPRLLEYIGSRAVHDDRLVALSTAFQVYARNDLPVEILAQLESVVAVDSELTKKLGLLVNPPVSETVRRHEEEHAEYLQRRSEEEERQKQQRAEWIAELRANPERVRTPPEMEPGTFMNDQYWLMHELQDSGLATSRSEYANWRALTSDFGESVAQEYRDAALNHWRCYVPSLRSAGAPGNSTPCSLIFGLAGLEIEATENADFPGSLDEAQARQAIRYVTWQLNGFPAWFERMHQAFPGLVEEAVTNELVWELENTGSDEPMHYILHDLVYHAPWLHARIAPAILEWAEANPSLINANRQYCLHILVNGGTDAARLAELANHQIAQTTDANSIAWWYALRVDCDPDNGIPELEQWLSGLDEEVATSAAQVFFTTLVNGRRLRESSPKFGHFQTAEHLKSLYILAHRNIRIEDEINRAGGGTYSPGPRDDAQDARGSLFNLLSEIPGKATYTVIEQLIREHPDPNRRPWMAKLAYKRAEQDGDLEPWTAEQVYAFDRSQTITPATHYQLFDLAIHRLKDLKNWLERGNDSPWRTWQRVDGETEMRTLIAGWLNQHCRDQYTTAQEPELANSQRMDIWLQNTKVHSPVPIELKLLDKGWSGPDLCERLRNQLAGDYLREESARCGVMLLVWQGNTAVKRWMISGQLVELNELGSALKGYWQEISADFPGVDAIEVMVIDLTLREHASDS
ncbi:hypothetical protein EV700_1415 [Fluviicoccus keumensis]|uniref:Uncharacterized protein n=1 Tax=Fluviicoccus keumensis TaxID=1435465 RepID=A0A4V2G622_9GAMM|nr:hypothetical protein [Fluviicoccus keumensis]RZU47026.1 hypothetical protein EV700_1415 [Fluviicoccus keumensis]